MPRTHAHSKRYTDRHGRCQEGVCLSARAHAGRVHPLHIVYIAPKLTQVAVGSHWRNVDHDQRSDRDRLPQRQRHRRLAPLHPHRERERDAHTYTWGAQA
jgi:hypothetical protein